MAEGLILQKHVKFLIRHLNVFPQQYSSLDTHRITLLFFAVSALDLLGELDQLLTDERRQSIIDWIYKLQISGAGALRKPLSNEFLFIYFTALHLALF
ncbi:hypothetical protein Q1695_012414 [Nippostrongylus brasiliensis]|nr:hypothetical protein Q1695_012414 [Nippostrongylus brasiliensis]